MTPHISREELRAASGTVCFPLLVLSLLLARALIFAVGACSVEMIGLGGGKCADALFSGAGSSFAGSGSAEGIAGSPARRSVRNVALFLAACPDVCGGPGLSPTF